MSETTPMYTNENGKSRPVDPDAEAQSALRQQWFSGFEQRLRAKNPDLLKDVKIRIVGSVSKRQAAVDSDIDIVISHGSSNALIVPQVRNAIFTLLGEMKMAGESTYEVGIQEVGNPLMFNAIANFRRKK